MTQKPEIQMFKALHKTLFIAVLIMTAAACNDPSASNERISNECHQIAYYELIGDLESLDGEMICTSGSIWLDPRSMGFGPVDVEPWSQTLVLAPGISYSEAVQLGLDDGTLVDLRGRLKIRPECFGLDQDNEDPAQFCISGPLAAFEDPQIARTR